MMVELTKSVITDLHELCEKHKPPHAILIVPCDNDSIQLALSNMSAEQVWMICAELAKRFDDNKHPLNG